MGIVKTVMTDTTLDFVTGEIKSKRWVKKEVKDRQQFVVLYLEHIGLINRLPHSELKFLLCCASQIEWESNELSLSPKTMAAIVECSGLKESTIRNAVSRLTKKNILSRKQANWYILNPEIFFKGKEIARAKMFELTYQWNIKPLKKA